MATLVATAGASNANSYLTQAEADAYFETRLAASTWEDSDDKEKALMMATRVLDKLLQPYTYLVPAANGVAAHYRTRAHWSGSPSTTTQKLAWPRTGMTDGNGNAIATNVIPQDLKDAVAELAMQLITADRTLDNDVSAQGISSLRVGSIALTFKDQIEANVIPDAVWNLLVPSWVEDETIVAASSAEFEMI